MRITKNRHIFNIKQNFLFRQGEGTEIPGYFFFDLMFEYFFGHPLDSTSRRQFALTGGYAFTDFKAQGQTITRLITDLANPPTRSLSPFSAYVTLTRCRGRNNIRLLKYFDEAVFRRHPNEDLREETDHLKELEKRSSNLVGIHM